MNRKKLTIFQKGVSLDPDEFPLGFSLLGSQKGVPINLLIFSVFNTQMHEHYFNQSFCIIKIKGITQIITNYFPG